MRCVLWLLSSGDGGPVLGSEFQFGVDSSSIFETRANFLSISCLNVVWRQFRHGERPALEEKLCIVVLLLNSVVDQDVTSYLLSEATPFPQFSCYGCCNVLVSCVRADAQCTRGRSGSVK